MKNKNCNIFMKVRNQYVTGSQTHVEVEDEIKNTFLIDNGAYQEREGEEFVVEDYSDVNAVFLTHAHIDHSGGLAEMEKNAKIPVYATQPTISLVPSMLQDMYNVMQMRGREITKDDLKGISKLERQLKEAKLYSPLHCGNAEVTFLDNAHILGASMIMLKASGINILFSGDYREEHPFMRTHGVSQYLKNNPVDVLVLESTYGNKPDHTSFSETIYNLAEILREVLKKGSVLMGTFAIDRTPVNLYMLSEAQKLVPELAKYPIYLDGRMAMFGLNVYENYEYKYKYSWHDIMPKNLHFITSKEQRQRLQRDPSPKITLATSGQYHGGPIVSWVPKIITNPNNAIISTGFIAHPLGRKIFEAQRGETIEYYCPALQVNAERFVLNGVSAHASNKVLRNLIEKCKKVNPKLKVIFVHGEPDAKIGVKNYMIEHNVLLPEDIYIQEANQHFEINKDTLASGKILVDDVV